jgi:predicted PurR-regulated permease PerM
MLINPKINVFLENPADVMNAAKTSITAVQQKVGFNFISDNSLENSLEKLSSFIPTFLNSTANLITKLALMLFVLYVMQWKINGALPKPYHFATSGKHQYPGPRNENNGKGQCAGYSININHSGYCCQGWVFNFWCKRLGIMGGFTGMFAFFPVVDTMIFWLPLVIYTYTTDTAWQAMSILLYSIIVTGNIDYISRIKLLKKLGDVHPVITILEVIIGLG